MKNIHILPTDKSSRLSIKDAILILHRLQWRKGTHHIYITSDEEIKKDEYYLGEDNNIYCLVTTVNFNGKKIILTTDQDLIKDGVQAIDDDFLEWFVKNPSCEEVEVEIESKFDRVDGHYHDVWEIIIPKEESCTCTDECLGYLTKTCKRIKEECCDNCNNDICCCIIRKQETLEEAKKYAELSYYGDEVDAFVRGVKWQKEQDKNKYSEESECVNMYLDDLNIPRKSEDDKEYSIVGRIKQLEKRYLKELSEVENHYLQQLNK